MSTPSPEVRAVAAEALDASITLVHWLDLIAQASGCECPLLVKHCSEVVAAQRERLKAAERRLKELL